MVDKKTMPELPLDAVTTEYWFRRQLEFYGLLAPTLPVTLVKQILQKHLGSRFKRFEPRVYEKENSQLWLSLMLKANEIIHLQHSSSEQVLVAVSSRASDRHLQADYDLISSAAFSAVRRELGIAKHWLVVLPGYPLIAPTRTELMQQFQLHLELKPECNVIQFPALTQSSPITDSTFYVEKLLSRPLPWELEQLV